MVICNKFGKSPLSLRAKCTHTSQGHIQRWNNLSDTHLNQSLHSVYYLVRRVFREAFLQSIHALRHNPFSKCKHKVRSADMIKKKRSANASHWNP